MTDWTRYVAYQCRNRLCQEHCINLVDSPPAQTKQCWSCYQETDPAELTVLQDHLPESHRQQPLSKTHFANSE
jgi:hypothetical protein